ncbi:MAG: DUF1015 family protein [Propionibacteriaceae bacterium]
MPRFEPFAALRYATTDLARVIAPPYDVLSDADVDGLQAKSAQNITFVDVPRGDVERYDRAAELYAQWQDDGVLVADPAPSLTIYRMRFTDASGTRRDIVGVLGALEVVDEGAGGVLPHERTTPKASTDRLDLTRATGANLSPVWGLSLAGGLTALLAEPGEPLGRVVDGDEGADQRTGEGAGGGVEHVVERISDPARIAAITTLLAGDDVLIADGHHRYGVARTYRDEVRATTGRDDTPAELTLAFVSELVADQLSVAAIHRLYAGIDHTTLRSTLATSFDLGPTPPPTTATLAAMESDGFMVLLTRGSGGGVIAETLTPRPGAFDTDRSLDGVWLEVALRDSPATVSYQHGLDEVLHAVTSGAAEAAVLIRPVSVAEIERTAREGLLMPPKSTFFTPKLKTGLVIRPAR